MIIDVHYNTPRPRGPELSSQLHSIIIELKDIGWSYRKIAANTMYLLVQSRLLFYELGSKQLPLPLPLSPSIPPSLDPAGHESYQKKKEMRLMMLYIYLSLFPDYLSVAIRTGGIYRVSEVW